MVAETKKLSLNGKNYEVIQLPATKAMPILLDLIKQLGEPLGKIMSASDPNSQTEFFEELGSSLKKMDPEKLMELIRRVLSENVIIDSKYFNPDMDIDLNFTGSDLIYLFQLVVFVVKTNFASFFFGLTEQVKQLSPEALKAK